MPLELTTVPRVPICRTGHFELESGDADFTLDHLAAAMNALANDPAVLPARVRLETLDDAHLGLDGMQAEAAGGLGGPSVGWVDNYAVAGNTLYGDLHIPEIVAANMEWAYPSRSIEGLFGYTTATGQTHEFMATGLLLLGQSWPGVTTLPDFSEVQAEFAAAIASGEIDTSSYATARARSGADPAQAGAYVSGALDALEKSRPVAALGATGRAPKPIREHLAAASIAVTDLRMRWYAAEREGELDDLPESYDFYSWYVTETRAEDDGTLFVLVLAEDTGRLWRFDATISGNTVTFSAPSEVMLEVVPVAAGSRPRPALERWGSRAESRAAAAAPASTRTTTEDQPMNDALRRALASSNGLDPETATEAEVEAAVLAASEANPPEGDVVPGTPEAGTAPDAELAAATARGERTISAGRLAELEAQASEGRTARARQVAGDRDRLVLEALASGRITPAESGLGAQDPGTGLYAIAETGWRRDLEDAPVVTARALGRLEAGKYPGTATARGGAPRQEGVGSGSAQRVIANIRGRSRRGEVRS